MRSSPELNQRLAVKLQPAKGFSFTSTGDRLGWAEDETGLHHVTLFIENGRIAGRARDGLREIAALGLGRFIITANQNLVLADIPAADKDKVAALLAGIRTGSSGGWVAAKRGCLRGAADLRSGTGGKRAVPAVIDHPARGRTRNRRARRRGHHHPHDRMSERLRPPVHVGNRPRWPFARAVQSLSGRRA